MSDTFVMSARQSAELDHAFERNGWTPADVKRLSSGNVLTDFRKVLLGHAVITVSEHLIDLDADPFLPKGWKIEEHQKGGQFTWDASKVALYFSKEQEGSSYIEGNKLRDELKARPVYNANLLDYLLKHPHLIPEEWKGKYIFFWGTIYRNSDGDLCVRDLYWDGDRWDCDGFWLDYDWSDRGPAAVPAS